jgi:hypothetical protein
MNTSADELAKTYILIDLRERDTNDEIELLWKTSQMITKYILLFTQVCFHFIRSSF